MSEPRIQQVVVPLRASMREQSAPGGFAFSPIEILWTQLSPQVIAAIDDYERNGWELVEREIDSDMLIWYTHTHAREVFINALLIISIIGFPFVFLRAPVKITEVTGARFHVRRRDTFSRTSSNTTGTEPKESPEPKESQPSSFPWRH